MPSMHSKSHGLIVDNNERMTMTVSPDTAGPTCIAFGVRTSTIHLSVCLDGWMDGGMKWKDGECGCIGF